MSDQNEVHLNVTDSCLEALITQIIFHFKLAQLADWPEAHPLGRFLVKKNLFLLWVLSQPVHLLRPEN